MYRVGNGIDVHQLVIDRKLILGGVDIPFKKGLLGHSDADVLVHSIIDALLGAAGKGVIGEHFPDTDQTYKDISSLLLLKKTKNIIDGYVIVNIDATILAEKPKLQSYFPQMIKNISRVLVIDDSQINIKATTTEQLGFVGREEGMAVYTTVLLKLK
ncbi:MAG: 2-C-methyl-D-erythritol 2,4-cyclodiphosphate synthase [Candidatus Margulisbacteria bacterium GWF2_35_9]|nr:MAG: 2-C-methyl-D-erythritol 2,4-cyclodiphosphate synthase [Candidatus Margulisbacteria bacterium GWF2_35_9]